MEQIERIKEMERCLDVSETTLKALSDALDALERNEDAIRTLFEYYGSPLWRADYKDDESGRIPKDLKRGVLSEDAVYDLLTDYHELLRRMNRFAKKSNTQKEYDLSVLEIRTFEELDFSRLMKVYAEGNRENAEELFPDEMDAAVAIQKAEEDFRSYLKEAFFRPGESYQILESNGEWVCALRLSELPGRRFYIQALETTPGKRRNGYASALLRSVIEKLKEGGDFVLCDCVSKTNFSSLKTHLRCGFSITEKNGYDWLSGTMSPYTYSMEYRFSNGLTEV